MAPARKTTPEQLQFLELWLAEFLQKQSRKELDTFWPKMKVAWLKEWPEEIALGLPLQNMDPDPNTEIPTPLTDEQRARLTVALDKRFSQLRNWFFNEHAKLQRQRGGVSQSTRSLAALLFKVRPKSRRRHQVLELYQKTYEAKVRAALRASEYDSLNEAAQCRDEDAQWIDDEDDAVKMKRVSEARKNRMKVRRRVVQEQWDAEDAGVQEKIREMVKKEEIVQPPETDVTDDERTPEAYQLSIDEVPQVAEMFLGELYKMTGWMGVLVVGGPVPRAEGELGVTAVPFGKTPEGLDFEKWHPSWKKSVTDNLFRFLRQAIPRQVRLRRAIYKEGEGDTDEAQPAPGADVEMTAAPAPKKAKGKKKTGKSSETVAPAAPPAAVPSKPPRRPQKKRPETPKPPSTPTAPPTTTHKEADDVATMPVEDASETDGFGEADYPLDFTPSFSPDDATPTFLSQNFSPSHPQNFSPSHSQHLSPSHLQRSSSQDFTVSQDFPLLGDFALSQDFGHGFGLEPVDFASRPQDFSQLQELNGSQNWPDWRGEHLGSVAAKVARDVYTFPTGFGPDALGIPPTRLIDTDGHTRTQPPSSVFGFAEDSAPGTSAFAAPTPPRPRPTPRLRQGSSPSSPSFSFQRAGQYRHTHHFGSPLHATGGTDSPGTPSITQQEACSTPPPQPQSILSAVWSSATSSLDTPAYDGFAGDALDSGDDTTAPQLPATTVAAVATTPRIIFSAARQRAVQSSSLPLVAPHGEAEGVPEGGGSTNGYGEGGEEDVPEEGAGEEEGEWGGEEQRAPPAFICSSTNNNAARLRDEKAAEAEKRKAAAVRKAENMRLHNPAGDHNLHITQGRARPSRSIQPLTSRGEVVSLDDRNKALQQKAAADDDALLKALAVGKKRKGRGDLEEENSAPPAKKRKVAGNAADGHEKPKTGVKKGKGAGPQEGAYGVKWGLYEEGGMYPWQPWCVAGSGARKGGASGAGRAHGKRRRARDPGSAEQGEERGVFPTVMKEAPKFFNAP
ncbi:hypothetical protein DFH09DRAFT_1330759 [Mycena vulgaris]|nr:hypothetical protein DFH09DRAFT_1330759 [Mycena vulgaris]